MWQQCAIFAARLQLGSVPLIVAHWDSMKDQLALVSLCCATKDRRQQIGRCSHLYRLASSSAASWRRFPRLSLHPSIHPSIDPSIRAFGSITNPSASARITFNGRRSVIPGCGGHFWICHLAANFYNYATLPPPSHLCHLAMTLWVYAMISVTGW